MDNNFSVEPRFTSYFYDRYVQWSKSHGFPVVDRENLGEFIFVCQSNGQDLYCCNLWKTDSKMALIGFPVSNRDIPYELREGALVYLFKRMSEILKEQGFKKIWTTSATASIMSALEDSGFQIGDFNVNVYIKQL